MAHYFDKQQSSPLREQEITVQFGEQRFTFLSASGLFSREHLDNATRLLIEKAELGAAQSVLDLGCGWGVVAVMMKLRNPQMMVTASDINARAVLYTKKNAARHNVELEVLQSDLFEQFQDRNFDCILTNPPYVAGREVCFAFIEESFLHLNKNGSLQLVARHNKGGKVLGEYMKTTFGNMDVVAKQGGFHIYRSIKQ